MIEKFLTPSIIILSFLIAGFIAKKILIKYISALARRTKFEWDDIAIKSLYSFVVFWFFLIGVRISLTLTRAIAVLFIITIIITILKFITALSGHYSKKEEGFLQVSTIFVNLLKIAIIVIGLLLIFQSLGVRITPLLTALGVGGLAVALALQDTLSNLFAGLHIIFAGQIRVGDFIKLENGQKGEVVDITWRNSTIRTLGNNIIVIPNSLMAQAIVVNFYLNKKDLSVKIPVGVAYDSDLEKVEKVTLEIAKDALKTTPGGVKDFEPLVRFHTFNDFSIDMTVILRAKDFIGQYLVRHEFIKKLHKWFNKEGIEIPFPIRTIEMKK